MVALCTAVVIGCGGSSSAPTAGGVAEESYSSGGETVYAASQSYDTDSEISRSAAPSAAAPAPEMYAQASPPSAPAGMPAQGPIAAPQPNPTATDAAPGGGPLLIYEAHLYLAVFKVEENLKAVATAARDAGGFLSQQTDTSIVIRIPAAKFTAVVEAIEKLGDVLHRQVQATDVSEEFRDVEIRIRNAMQVRDRLAELLTRASKVEESLQIERELERLTGEIERLKGRMRFLQDRIAYSTITVTFQPKEQERLDNNMFRLPFDWLDSLGLQRLLSL